MKRQNSVSPEPEAAAADDDADGDDDVVLINIGRNELASGLRRLE